jgi:hypothetical protein
MFDRVTALAIIDSAYDRQRRCTACGAPTVVRNDEGIVVLECSDPGDDGVLARISNVLMPHTRRVVIDLRLGVAA